MFWDFITQFFTSGSAADIVGRVGLLLILTMVFYVLFFYAHKCNMRTFTIIAILAIAAVFALSFALPSSVIKFAAPFVLAVVSVVGIALFASDFHRDLFRMSFKRADSEDEYGRDDLNDSVAEIVKACLRLSKADTGALIIVADDLSDTILDSGTKVNAEISAELLETLFFPKTPLHDGAVVITDNKVVSAGCYLPLTQAHNLPREFGTRHRAAIGVSEAFPSLTAIVVSEETGIISAVRDGKIKRYLDANQLKAILECAMGLSDKAAEISIWGLVHDEEE